MRDDVNAPSIPAPTGGPEASAGPESTPTAATGYVSPRIDRLGTLAELTRGGEIGPDDGLGGAGDGGSL